MTTHRLRSPVKFDFLKMPAAARVWNGGMPLMGAVSLFEVWRNPGPSDLPDPFFDVTILFRVPAGILLLFAGYYLAFRVHELTVDADQRWYVLRRGNWPFIDVESGSLGQVEGLVVDDRVVDTEDGKACPETTIRWVWKATGRDDLCLHRRTMKSVEMRDDCRRAVFEYAEQLARMFRLTVTMKTW